ncbi:DUF6056 family protein [Hymenobacter koreensis]|uniref:Glycosyltransferase RgtA/B/C/D-like domain-containing protein n=1 Tax=Hymenobacter koreensis TaxID=1084523 RepID=A0ABP8IU12_9BACT
MIKKLLGLITGQFGLAGLALFMWLPYLLLCFFTQPYWDDYTYATLLWKDDLGSILVDQYRHWSGRYVAIGLLAGANPLTHGWLPGLGWVAFFSQVALVIAFAALVASLSGYVMRVGKSILIGILLYVVYASIIPDPYQGLYWFTGLTVYHSGLLLFLGCWLAAVAAIRAATAGAHYTWLVLASLLAVLATATNEVVMLTLCFALLVATLLAYYGRKTYWHKWLILLAAALAGGCIAVLAPGNYERLAVESGVLPLADRSWPKAAVGAVADAVNLLTRPAVWLCLGALLVLSLNAWMRLRPQPVVGKPLTPWLWPVLVGMTVAGVLLPSRWIYGVPAVGRVENLIIALLLVAVVFIGREIVAWAQSKHPNWQPLPRTWWMIVAILALGGLVRGPVYRAWRELAGGAPVFGQQHRQWHQQLRTAKQQGLREVTLPAVRGVVPYQVLIWNTDMLSVSAGHIVNQSVATYYGLDSVRVDGHDLPPAEWLR